METHQEYVHDAILAGAFSVLAMVAGYRTFIYFTLKGSGKVVTLFYTLIFTTSFFRAVWFGISSAYLEGSYVPRATGRMFMNQKMMTCFLSYQEPII